MVEQDYVYTPAIRAAIRDVFLLEHASSTRLGQHFTATEMKRRAEMRLISGAEVSPTLYRLAWFLVYRTELYAELRDRSMEWALEESAESPAMVH